MANGWDKGTCVIGADEVLQVVFLFVSFHIYVTLEKDTSTMSHPSIPNGR
jgi:hypothetical protein